MPNKPFLKWAGGKRWLVDHHLFKLPDYSGTYFEPFLGGGAVFFQHSPEKAVLSDANAHLIETYRVIRDDWRSLLELLAIHHVNHSKAYYYEQRSQQFDEPCERAAQFIYLNRACWNGLYRVNLRGEFNVPIGTKNWVLSPDDDFEKLSAVLKNSELKNCDFEETLQLASAGDLIFVDPPYTVAHNFNGFVKYNENIFSWPDQQRLKSSITIALERGAIVVMTNADHPSIHDLYEDLDAPIIVDRHSKISGSVMHRRKTTEALYVFRP